MSEPEDDFVPVTDNLIRDKIIHALTIWPRISPSMLQVGIGTSISPKMWHPIFDSLIKEGRIQKEEVSGRGPTGRDQVYTVVSLVPQNKPNLGPGFYNE